MLRIPITFHAELFPTICSDVFYFLSLARSQGLSPATNDGFNYLNTVFKMHFSVFRALDSDRSPHRDAHHSPFHHAFRPVCAANIQSRAEISKLCPHICSPRHFRDSLWIWAGHIELGYIFCSARTGRTKYRDMTKIFADSQDSFSPTEVLQALIFQAKILPEAHSF